jgi:hypothetical protein
MVRLAAVFFQWLRFLKRQKIENRTKLGNFVEV